MQEFDAASFMKRIAKGDEDAFRCLYDEFGAYVFKIVAMQLHNNSKAEELTQDIFLKIWRFASKYDPSRPFKPWLSRVVSNEIISYRRAQEERTESIEELAETGYTPAEEMDSYRDRQLSDDISYELQNAMGILTDNQRQVVVMKYYEGLKIREIADGLGIGESAVKARLYTALETLSTTAQRGKNGL
ncbi:MAG TPA: RNA polymerase sigma factor [Caldisericia bacterium]|nr:RNA polymerase sigma factor [Caldisericia bacterium]HPA65791.1 RNA polymerase sigma factor [Caldisericia bacterium]HQN36858.1 RNA polymerase sigma factor [Caldisericia bacterium]HUN18857.1 RNA polymerase sigma factor [Caldisericia bacterium]